MEVKTGFSKASRPDLPDLTLMHPRMRAVYLVEGWELSLGTRLCGGNAFE